MPPRDRCRAPPPLHMPPAAASPHTFGDVPHPLTLVPNTVGFQPFSSSPSHFWGRRAARRCPRAEGGAPGSMPLPRQLRSSPARAAPSARPRARRIAAAAQRGRGRGRAGWGPQITPPCTCLLAVPGGIAMGQGQGAARHGPAAAAASRRAQHSTAQHSTLGTPAGPASPPPRAAGAPARPQPSAGAAGWRASQLQAGRQAGRMHEGACVLVHVRAAQCLHPAPASATQCA